jgi:hypothetical protein
MSFLIGVSALITGYTKGYTKYYFSGSSPPKARKYLFSSIYMSAIFLYNFTQF